MRLAARWLARWLACALGGAALAVAPGAWAQAADILACAKDPSSDSCLVIPGGTQAAPAAVQPQWSASASGGIAPRQGAPTGSYETLSLHRQLGRSYVQLGAIHYSTTLQQGEASASSNYQVATLGFGGNYNQWVLDTYASYGRQTFGEIRFTNGAHSGSDSGGSPYVGGGISFGRMFQAGPRLFLTPTAQVAYAWSRLLHPLGETGPFTTSEPTWTTAGRLRLDWLPGRGRQTYLGISAAGLWSNNATSLIGGVTGGGYGGGASGNERTSQHIHDTWVELGAHASVAVSRSLRVEATAARTVGLISGNATTVGLGLRRSF